MKYPEEWEKASQTAKVMARERCRHQTQDPYTCMALELGAPRSAVTFQSRCLCDCHVVDQHEHFDDYE